MTRFFTDLWAELRRIAAEKKGDAGHARDAIQREKNSPVEKKSDVSHKPES